MAIVSTTLQLGDGTRSVLEGSARALELVATVDGSAPLGELVDRARLPESEAKKLRREVVTVARDLLELGALRFA